MEVYSEEWWNKLNALALELEVLPMLQTQPATSNKINVPPIMPLTTPLSSHLHQHVAEAPSMLSSSQTSQNCGIQVQSSKRKRITWTMEEHRLFLEGLHIYGRGYWKKISNYIQTKDATQVASHAQKYFIRNNISKEKKKRKSIHDLVLSQPMQVQEGIHFNPPINMPHPRHLNIVNTSHQIPPITGMMQSNHINHINHHPQYNGIHQTIY
ncbi:hypothetical protein VNO80_02912 [Phaseolus coccineus]|uniref:Uncharacterized protein n=1 Tax=Phaseolus coccineus TaxID=3886 RepID=A0AAN9NR90_PHACN